MLGRSLDNFDFNDIDDGNLDRLEDFLNEYDVFADDGLDDFFDNLELIDDETKEEYPYEIN